MSNTVLTLRIDDCGGYYQVYGINQKGTEWKVGNIYPPKYELFGQVLDENLWTIDEGRKYKSKSYSFSAAARKLMRGALEAMVDK